MVSFSNYLWDVPRGSIVIEYSREKLKALQPKMSHCSSFTVNRLHSCPIMYYKFET